jgi:hypothetical protein
MESNVLKGLADLVTNVELFIDPNRIFTLQLDMSLSLLHLLVLSFE